MDGLDSDNYLIYDAVNITFNRSMTLSPWLRDCIEFDIEIHWLQNESDIFPSKQKVYFYPKTGKLVFGDNDKINAILYKDNILSSIYTSDLPDDAFINK
jgi:hypothetical protein